MTKHDYSQCPGGPPTENDYYWCNRCGVLKITNRLGVPTSWFVPGKYTIHPTGRRDIKGLPKEPKCIPASTTSDIKEILKEILSFLAKIEACHICTFDLDLHGKHHPKYWEALKARAKRLLGDPGPN